MPQANITYDTPYNHKLIHLLHEMDAKHLHNQPIIFQDRTSNYHGAKIGGGSSPDQKFILSGNSPSYPPAHFHTGMVTKTQQTGGGLWTAIGNAVGSVADSLTGMGASGGRLTRAKSVGRRVKRGRETKFEGLPDTVLPAPSAPKARKGKMAKGSPEAKAWGERMKALRRNKSAPKATASVKKGGKRGSKKGGISLPSLNDVLEVATPVAKEVGKIAIDKGAEYLKKKLSGGAASGGGRSKRAEIVKRIMKEKGLKMIEASKYVKQHGLY